MKPAAYGPFAYSPIIRRAPLRWPNGAHVALWVVPNIEFFPLDQKIPLGTGGTGTPAPDIPGWSVRDYGNRVGVFRVMQVLDRYAMRGTAALNSDLCAQHPEIIEEGCNRRWEWMGHNESNSRRLNELKPGEERPVIKNVLDTIASATGVRPTGWLSSGLQETWNTLDHLAAERIEYVCDWVNDDQPYTMSLENGRRLIAMPYSHVLNDKPQYERDHRTPREFKDMICAQFDVLYREGETSGRVMAIAVHPYLTGMAHRIGAFDAALEYVCRHDRVWKATGSEIARHFREQQASW